MSVTDWIGAVGVFILLVAYVLNNYNVLQGNGVWYPLLNTLGAGLACYASIRLVYYPFIVLEGVWSLVSAIALLKALRLR
ncbi:MULTISPECIES: CBU_0592 family membrane protein [unclassified Paraflavitalea]|uniref:CBU_0592 family membrane protein n=1 Tax=unclassified Paraflavitalea TaxID=2798305 RepID=UPI003D334976